MTDDKLSEALGIAPVVNPPTTITSTAIVPLANTQDKVADDSEYARQNIHDVIQKTSNAIDQLAQIAEESQHPRAYEVLATLLKQQADAAEQLLTIHKKRKDLQNGQSAQTQTVNIDKAVFVGTNDELLDLMNPQVITHDNRND